jgi:hypothetical protein
VPSHLHDDALYSSGANLIRRAFDIARLSDKPAWQEMSSAVLKNRILDLTSRRFDETLWRVSSFQEWLDLFDEIVAVDRTRHPPWVRLLDAEQTEAQSAEPLDDSVMDAATTMRKRWRIRRDLWQAVTDVGRAGEWYWNVDHVELLPLHPPEGMGYVRVPTFTPDELARLRRSFAEQFTLTEDERYLVDRWAGEFLPDAVLPVGLKGQWIAALKAAVLDRLRLWFETTGGIEPVDLVQEPGMTPPRDELLDELRSLVLRCIQHMTRSELEDLRLPPAALLRIMRR